MKDVIKVGVKFCGNCNPHLDMTAIFEAVKNNFPDVEFVRWDEGAFSILLILNSCPVGCATRPDFSGSTLIITSDSIDHTSTSPENLYDDILKALNELKIRQFNSL